MSTNCFLLFCSELAVLIFTMLLDDIPRPNGKTAQVPRGINLMFYVIVILIQVFCDLHAMCAAASYFKVALHVL